MTNLEKGGGKVCEGGRVGMCGHLIESCNGTVKLQNDFYVSVCYSVKEQKDGCQDGWGVGKGGKLSN